MSGLRAASALRARPPPPVQLLSNLPWCGLRGGAAPARLCGKRAGLQKPSPTLMFGPVVVDGARNTCVTGGPPARYRRPTCEMEQEPQHERPLDHRVRANTPHRSSRVRAAVDGFGLLAIRAACGGVGPRVRSLPSSWPLPFRRRRGRFRSTISVFLRLSHARATASTRLHLRTRGPTAELCTQIGNIAELFWANSTRGNRVRARQLGGPSCNANGNQHNTHTQVKMENNQSILIADSKVNDPFSSRC